MFTLLHSRRRKAIPSQEPTPLAHSAYADALLSEIRAMGLVGESSSLTTSLPRDGLDNSNPVPQ